MRRSRMAFVRKARELLDGVVQAYDPVRVVPRGKQGQRNVTVTSLDEWNAFSNEDRNNVDNELIDFALIEKRGDHPAAAHHPDVFARNGAKTFRERADGIVDEIHILGHREFGRPVREDIVFDLRAESYSVAAHPSLVVRLPSPQDRVDGTKEFTHAVVAGRPRTVQPIDTAIGTGDVAVCTGRDVDDNLPGSFQCCARLCKANTLWQLAATE
jgi:hypothetical protein